MKLSKIKKLSVEDFEDLMNEETYNYITGAYNQLSLALERYVIGATEFNEEEYLDIDEYFKLIKEQSECIE